MYQFIQQQQDLQKVINLMDSYPIYGLDTEFIKVDTLWPKLGVFQINVNGEVFLLDGAALDLSEFWIKLFGAEQNVFHACSEDIDLIYHYASHKSLDNVFDTQVGMSFLGHGLQVSYQNALKLMLDVDIEKDQTRLRLACSSIKLGSIEYMQPMMSNTSCCFTEKVKNELEQKQLLDCVLEDCRNLTYEIGVETPVHQLYSDVGNFRNSRKQLMQLQQLAVWREQMVKALNQPRSFILKISHYARFGGEKSAQSFPAKQY